MHEILIRAISGLDGTSVLEIRCGCGVFLLDRKGTPAQASLIEITNLVTAHYVHASRPELANGGKPKLIEGKA